MEVGTGNQRQPLVEHRAPTAIRPPDLGSLDEVLYEGADAYTVVDEGQRRAWIADAVAHHVATNPYYARLAHGDADLADAVRNGGDLAGVPLVSSGLFKRRDVRSATLGHVRLSHSSGTRGTQSIVPRDRQTMERFVGTVQHGLREFLGSSDLREAFVLGPRTEEAGDLWFSYVLSLVELLHDTAFFVRGDDVEPVVVGPPALLFDVLSWMEMEGTRLDLGPSAYVVTAGGWKRRADEAVARDELMERAQDRLGVSPPRFRDAYNMIELNTVMFECQHHRKHVPPWVDATARQPSDLSLADDGEVGILAFLDPTALSYPAFVLCDDFGTVRRSTCPCGRPGATVEVVRRMDTVEQRGCALRMERYGRSTDAAAA